MDSGVGPTLFIFARGEELGSETIIRLRRKKLDRSSGETIYVFPLDLCLSNNQTPTMIRISGHQ